MRWDNQVLENGGEKQKPRCVPNVQPSSACFYPPVATDGDVHGRLPALPPEHLRRHPVPAVDLGGGNRRGAAGPLHRLYMLLLREYFLSRRTGPDRSEPLLKSKHFPACLQTMLTAISMSAIATNGVVPGISFPFTPSLSSVTVHPVCWLITGLFSFGGEDFMWSRSGRSSLLYIIFYAPDQTLQTFFAHVSLWISGSNSFSNGQTEFK